MKTPLPKSVKVGGFDISVEKWSPQSAYADGSFGQFSGPEQCIRVEVEGPLLRVVDTLIHEINHAIYWAYHLEDSDEEERIVSTFASAWLQIYRDNREVLDWITEALGASDKGIAELYQVKKSSK